MAAHRTTSATSRLACSTWPRLFGYAVTSVLGGRWIDHIMAREARKAERYDADGKLVYLPEDRMRENIWLAASLYPAALIWYGWTVQNGVHWIVPCIASFFFGLGNMLVFGAVTTMLTEFTPKRSSSGVALNNFVRQHPLVHRGRGDTASHQRHGNRLACAP